MDKTALLETIQYILYNTTENTPDYHQENLKKIESILAEDRTYVVNCLHCLKTFPFWRCYKHFYLHEGGMEIFHEEYCDQRWIICDEKELKSRLNFATTTWRTIWKFCHGTISTMYKQGKLWHRLDGPAVVHQHVDDKLTRNLFFNPCRDLWYVNDICLEDFSSFYVFIDRVFKYIQEHPQFVNEILILAKYNNWELPLEKLQPIIHSVNNKKQSLNKNGISKNVK